MMKELVEALMNDENGINEEAYNALCDLLDHMSERESLTQRERIDARELRERVKMADATDGRFYWPT